MNNEKTFHITIPEIQGIKIKVIGRSTPKWWAFLNKKVSELIYDFKMKFYKRELKISHEERIKLAKQYDKLSQNQHFLIHTLLTAQTMPVVDELHFEIKNNLQRIIEIEIKLIKSCPCGKDHSKRIAELKNLSETLLNDLLKNSTN